MTSPIDGFQKLLFRTHDGLARGDGLIPLHKPGAVSLCLSSQVGCPDGVRLLRDGTDERSAEIWRPGRCIDQFIQAREIVPVGRPAGDRRRYSWGWASRF